MVDLVSEVKSRGVLAIEGNEVPRKTMCRQTVTKIPAQIWRDIFRLLPLNAKAAMPSGVSDMQDETRRTGRAIPPQGELFFRIDELIQCENVLQGIVSSMAVPVKRTRSSWSFDESQLFSSDEVRVYVGQE